MKRGPDQTAWIRKHSWAYALAYDITVLLFASLTFVLLNELRFHAHFYFFSQSDYLIRIGPINSRT